MKKTTIIVAVSALFILGACNKSGETDISKPTVLETELDSVSYVLGTGYGEWLKTNTGMKELNENAFMSAILRAVNEKESEIPKEITNTLMRGFMDKQAKIKEEEMAKEFAPNAEEAAAWLKEVKNEKGVIELEPGLLYKIVKEGLGSKPVDGDQVSVNYIGKLKDGSTFDSSKEGEPTSFGVNQVIPGWTKALKNMPLGSKWTVYIAPELAYGLYPPRGSSISPNSALMFDVELLDIKKVEVPQPTK